MRFRAPRIFGLAWLILAAADLGAQPGRNEANELRPVGPPAARKSCRGPAKAVATEAFRQGLKAFEQKDWPEAIRQLSVAAEHDCRGDLVGIALYGRWRYPFEPQVYLGMALSHLADCLTDCTRHCSGVDSGAPGPPAMAGPACLRQSVERLRSLPASSVRLRCWQGRCAKLSDAAQKVYSSPLDCPATDLFAALRQSGFAVDQDRIADAGADCEEVSTPDEWLWQVLTGTRGYHQQVCEELREELVAVAQLCREPSP